MEIIVEERVTIILHLFLEQRIIIMQWQLGSQLVFQQIERKINDEKSED